MKTKVFVDIFKGSKIFAVWAIDDNNQKLGQYPVFSMGAKKSTALIKHLDEFIEYARNIENKEDENKVN